MNTNNNNNNSNFIFPSQNPGNLKQRYCTVCHVQTVQNPTGSPLDANVFMCPNCGVKTNLKGTEPAQKGRLTTTFQPAYLQGHDRKRIYQPDDQPATRSEEFILKQEQDRHEEGFHDINLKMLKSQGFQITSVDYYIPEAD